jgi:hypothetical protein
VASNQPDQPKKSDAQLLAEKLWALSKTGDFNSIGKIIKQLDLKHTDTISILGWLCSEANTAQSAAIVIEVLIQRAESTVLLKLGGIAWLHGNASVSNRCLQAALDLGPLDELFEEVRSWPEKSSSAENQHKKEDYECMVVVQIAERGHYDAFYSAAVILRAGILGQPDLSAARKYFLRFALRIADKSSSDLALAGKAFAELVELTKFQHQAHRSYYSTMAEVAKTASKHLSALFPGDEFAVMLDLPEGADLEFKSTARWNLNESRKDPEMEHAIVKTVAAFLNTGGGVLVIGVGDKKEELGLEFDYKTFTEKPNADGFMLFLGTLFCKEFGTHLSQLIQFRVVEFHDKEFCRVEVKKSSELVFVKRKEKDVLYVRVQNLTQPISEPSKIEAWRKQRELASNKPS